VLSLLSLLLFGRFMSNTPFTRSSKLPANVFKIHMLIARRSLEVCWTFAAMCYNGRASSMFVCWTFAGSCKHTITFLLAAID